MTDTINLQQQQLLNQPTNNQRITNIRLQKQLQFLRQSKLQYKVDKIQSNKQHSKLLNINNTTNQHLQITYRITIHKKQPLQNQLILLIPKHYPFHQPLYYYNDQQTTQNQNQSSIQPNEQQQKSFLYSNKQNTRNKISPLQSTQFNLAHQLAHAQSISQLLIWIPKYKILELVELIAIKIKQKHQQQSIIHKYSLGKIIHYFNNPKIIFTFAILLRILVSLGSFSGKGDWPNLGDFQAHRNWMSITVNKPIQDWYVEPTENIWWRIDYPPIAAYLSYIFGSIYKHIQPQAMVLQRGYESPLLITFMRLSALLVEMLLVFPAYYLLSNQVVTQRYTITKKYSLLLLCTLLIKPDLILIDHGHFQYNSLIIGLILGAFYCLLNRNYYVCCVLFTIAIHSKQMAVYYALAFFAGLIGRVWNDSRGNKTKFISEVLKFGVIVISVSLAIWLPFLLTGSAGYVLEAIFPVHRGLYQLKVQNFWCISDVIMKWENKFSKQVLMVLCFFISTILSLPSMLTIISISTKKTLTLGFYTISMTFFLFSYHVHEKSILLPLAIAPFLTQYLGPYFVSNLIISGMLGTYHLLKEDGQWLQYFVLLVFYAIFMQSSNSITCNLQEFVLQQRQNTTICQKLHKNIFVNDQSSTTFKLVKYMFYLIPLLLHLAQLTINPPIKLEYLHHLLFAFYSFCFNAYSLIICNGILIQNLYQRLIGKKIQEKQN